MRTGIELIKSIENGEAISSLENSILLKGLFDVLKSSSVLTANLLGLSHDELARRGNEVAHYIRLKDSIEALGKATHSGDGDAD